MIGIAKNVIIKILQEDLDVIDARFKKHLPADLVTVLNHSQRCFVNKHLKIVV